jgi:SAM-dependent methyltransferase
MNARVLRRRLARIVFERGAIEDTYGAADLSEFGLAHPDRVEYRPSSWRHLARGLRGCAVTRKDAFLDYGCGKGRVVHQAASLPFGRVIGVEISPQLLSVARRNLERNRHRLACRDVELVNSDARTYDVPDDVNYVYMYNPFVGDVFRDVLRNIERSLERRPRRLRLIYVYPVMDAALKASRWFTVVSDSNGRHERIAVYEASFE